MNKTWIEYGDYIEEYNCTECNWISLSNIYSTTRNFCPKCGSKQIKLIIGRWERTFVKIKPSIRNFWNIFSPENKFIKRKFITRRKKNAKKQING